MRTSGRDPYDEPDDARSRDDACRPLVLEASANLVEPNDAAKAVEHHIECGSLIAQDGEVEALQALRHVDADLRLALAKVLGYLSLRFGGSRDADRTFNGDALGIAERARREIPEAIEGVSTFVIAWTEELGTGAALRRLLPASSCLSLGAAGAPCG